jgi:Flp pilus assembly protein CpaB
MQLATKLLSTKRGTLIVAGAAALFAGALILIYLNGYRNSVKSAGAPVTVLIARQNIPKGTSGTVVASKHLFTTTTMRESQLREGAFSDPTSLNGKVTTREIYKGAQLTAGAFATGGESLTAKLTNKERILGVPLDSAHGLIGEIEAGSHVDVYALFKIIPHRADGTPIGGGTAYSILKRIITDVTVVDIAGKSGTGLGASSTTTKVLLRLTDKQAGDVAFASDEGKVWLSLRPGAGATSTKPSLVTVGTVLGITGSQALYRGMRGIG